jgi:hypothetical protein
MFYANYENLVIFSGVVGRNAGLGNVYFGECFICNCFIH